MGTALTTRHDEIDFRGMLDVAGELVKTGFLPDHVKTAGQAVAIILAGRELGLEPMLALRSISMVKGKIVVAADAQLALFKAKGGRARFERLDETAAVLQLVHPNGDTHTETFTIEDAKRANLLNNANWRSFPKAMLRSRCITAGLKSVGFEPTSGTYDPDEAQHFAAPVREPAAREPVRDALPAPVADVEPDVEPDYTVCPAGPHAGAAWSDPTAFDLRDLVTMHDWFAHKAADADDPEPMQRYAEAVSAEITRRRDIGRASLATRGDVFAPEPATSDDADTPATDDATEFPLDDRRPAKRMNAVRDGGR